jgi:choice-of-anchor B domain-containing protein
MKINRVLVTLALGFLAVGIRASHDESLGIRFVATDGGDVSACLDHHQPCASLAYALDKAEPGHSIRVAAGTYDLTGLDPEKFLWGPVKARGGYSKATEWEQSDPQANRTVVTGLDARYRTVLAARGFTLAAGASADGAVLQSVQVGPVSCVNEFAGGHPCRNIDLQAQIPLSQFSSHPVSAANLWGMVDRNDNREYAVIGLSNATAVVDVTDPTNPREVGSVPGNNSSWREVKILQRFDAAANRYRAYAFISTEAPGSGLQIIDLSGLPNSIALAATLSDVATQHTLYISNIDYASNTSLPGSEPFLYVAGSKPGNGRWRAYHLGDPTAPQLVGEAPAGTGYMHDSTSLLVSDARAAQCAAGHNPCQVLVDFNENAVEIWDVTEKAAPLRLSTTQTGSFRYVHSGWPSSDQQFLIVHDELDEIRGSVPLTNIYTLDVADLRAPRLNVSWQGADNSTDHNGYTRGNRYYVSHYRRGLVVFDITDPRTLREIGYFDTFLMATANIAGTDGAWGVYPFLPSGTVLISDIDNGLFVLKDNTAGQVGTAGSLRVAASAQTFGEAAGAVLVSVQRVGGSSGPVTVNYATQDGTAVAGSDYTAANGTFSWSDGDFADKLISIAITSDSNVEPDETFTLNLSAPAGGATLTQSTDTLTIGNDDAAVAPAPTGGGGGAIDWLSLLLAVSLLAKRRRL